MSKLPETNDPPQTHRIGVWICDCGGRISGAIDTSGLREHAAALPGVAHAAREAYPCSKAGQERIRQAIAEHQLDRVLIAGCAPRLVEKLFRSAAQPAGLDGAFVEIANIREQCALAHPNNSMAATKKAAGLIDMGLARLGEVRPQAPHTRAILPSAVVIGSGLGGMAIALSLADRGVDVSLVEQTNRLGGSQLAIQGQAGGLASEMAAAASNHPRIRIYLNRQVTGISGQPGKYRVEVGQGNDLLELECGAIVVAGDACPEPLDPNHWYDRAKVQSQASYGIELEKALRGEGDMDAREVVMILPGTGEPGERICCQAGIRQAIRTRQLDPSARVAVLFSDLAHGEEAKADLMQARSLGVQFYRYPQDRPPQIGAKTVELFDTLSNQAASLPYDRIVLATPLSPQPGTDSLAARLHLPQDHRGFLLEPRARLRPERQRENGVFVAGGSHLPSGTSETLFQAYLVSARVMNFLQKEDIKVESPVAHIDDLRCTGCGSCVQVCPTDAIRLEKTNGLLSLSQVDTLRCTGCGSCVVACPVKAIELPEWGDMAILAEIDAALRAGGRAASAGPQEPVILAFACEWSAYAAADLAGLRGHGYPPGVRVIRMNCSARFDPNYALWALINGADGVFLGACEPGECHYGAGNRHAEERIEALKEQLAAHGVDPGRVKFAFLSGDDGETFARMMNQFAAELRLRQPKTAAATPPKQREPVIEFAK